ncbi:MAG: hypothetical protein AAB676_00155 [Verrucomicrobiota bacterium]
MERLTSELRAMQTAALRRRFLRTWHERLAEILRLEILTSWHGALLFSILHKGRPRGWTLKFAALLTPLTQPGSWTFIL